MFQTMRFPISRMKARVLRLKINNGCLAIRCIRTQLISNVIVYLYLRSTNVVLLRTKCGMYRNIIRPT